MALLLLCDVKGAPYWLLCDVKGASPATSPEIQIFRRRAERARGGR